MMTVPTEVLEARRELEALLRVFIDHQQRLCGPVVRDPIARVERALPRFAEIAAALQKRIVIVADEVGTNITHIMLRA